MKDKKKVKSNKIEDDLNIHLQPVVCPKCKTFNKVGDKVCRFCGYVFQDK